MGGRGGAIRWAEGDKGRGPDSGRENCESSGLSSVILRREEKFPRARVEVPAGGREKERKRENTGKTDHSGI